MTYVKAVVVGLVTAVLFVVGVACLELAFVVVRISAFNRSNAGSGGIGAVSVGILDPVSLAALVSGFVLGFWWTVRRGKGLRVAR